MVALKRNWSEALHQLVLEEGHQPTFAYIIKSILSNLKRWMKACVNVLINLMILH